VAQHRKTTKLHLFAINQLAMHLFTFLKVSFNRAHNHWKMNKKVRRIVTQSIFSSLPSLRLIIGCPQRKNYQRKLKRNSALNGFTRLARMNAITCLCAREMRSSHLKQDRRCASCGSRAAKIVGRETLRSLVATKAYKCAGKLRYLPERQSALAPRSGFVWESSFFPGLIKAG